MEYFAIDFETANGYHNSACSVGVVRFVDGKEKDSVYSLIKPAKMYFKPEFIDIHHISYDDVRDKPQFPEVWQTIIVPFLGTERNEKKQINFIYIHYTRKKEGFLLLFFILMTKSVKWKNNKIGFS